MAMTRQAIDAGFLAHFQVNNVFDDPMMRVIAHRVYNFDVIKFDTWLIRTHGFDVEKHGSQATFIGMKFGEEAEKFARDLLDSDKIAEV